MGNQTKCQLLGRNSPKRFLPDVIKATPSEILINNHLQIHLALVSAFVSDRISLAEITREISLADPEDACKWTPKMKLMPKADPYPDLTLKDSSTITNQCDKRDSWHLYSTLGLYIVS